MARWRPVGEEICALQRITLVCPGEEQNNRALATADDPDTALPGAKQDLVARATETLSAISAFRFLLLAAIFLYDIVGNFIVGILFLELPSTVKRGAMLRTTIVYYAVFRIPRRVIDRASCLLGGALFLAFVFGGWDATIVSWELLEIEGAGAFEVPIYPVRTLIILFSAICAPIYLQLFYVAVTGKGEAEPAWVGRIGAPNGRAGKSVSEPDVVLVIILIALIGLVVAGLHLGIVLGMVSLGGTFLLFDDLNITMDTANQAAYAVLRNSVFAAIPLFVLMGEFMSKSGMARDPYKICNYFLRALPGRLAMASSG